MHTIVHLLIPSMRAGRMLVYGGLFLLIGGYSMLYDSRPWTSRHPAQRYLLLVTLVLLFGSMLG